jgi:hypothetical protein
LTPISYPQYLNRRLLALCYLLCWMLGADGEGLKALQRLQEEKQDEISVS